MDDYGYFGKGSTGYAHYMQTFKSTRGGGGGGSSGSGCLTSILAALGIIVMITILLANIL